ncbi:hypothetical protein [uncultured Pseudacidovorax sp.]|uniref:hypothetical protein n=1 Tax=uncultured Pseudacidovorax sp. TaxID=679313 RepID=UPI0025E3FDCC|nr:hypothetical protein [uncultured Pseudacidovorax sp.]
MSKTKPIIQAASATQGDTEPLPRSASHMTLRDKMDAMKAKASARVSATPPKTSGSQGYAERAKVSTEFGSFYESEQTRRLLTDIALAEALKAVTAALDSFDKAGAIATARALLPVQNGPDANLTRALLDLLENGGPTSTPEFGNVVQHIKTRAAERWMARGHAATSCERVPDRHTVQPSPPSGRPYGQWLSDK